MNISSIEFNGFRNIDCQIIKPSDKVTLLYGKNAEGKTNAIEGIYLFAFGRSFRASKEKEMVSFNKDVARLRMVYKDRRRENVREIAISSSGKRILKHNDVVIKKLSEFAGGFRVVLFCPSHLSIVSGSPSDRREFLDSAIAQLDREYMRALQKYTRQLAERNKIIKNYYLDKESFDATIDIWSHELALSGETVSKKRFEYVLKINQFTEEIFKDMTKEKEKTCLEYPEPKSAEEYYQLLMSNTEREIKAGVTLYGPHRDDISISLNERPARLFCSQGQMRSIALAMKMSEGEISKCETGEYPVFLLDDVLSELDESRRNFVLSGMENKQVIITACDPEVQAQSQYCVESGKYTFIK